MLACRRLPPSLASRLKSRLSTLPVTDLGFGLSATRSPAASAFAIASSQLSNGSVTGLLARTAQMGTHAEGHSKAGSPEHRPEPTLRDFHEGLKIAYQSKDYNMGNALLQRLVKEYHSNTSIRFTLFHEFLGRDDLAHFSTTTILAVLNLFKTSPFEMKQISVNPLIQLLKLPPEVNTEVHDAAFDCLMEHLATLQAPSGVDNMDFKPSTSISQTFTLFQSLVSNDSNKALQLFDTLVETGHIPPHTLPPEDAIDLSNIKFVILSSTVKASLYWGWCLPAAESIVDLLDPKARENPLIPSLAEQTLSAILEAPIQNDPYAHLDAAVTIIQKAHPIRPIPAALIRQCYDLAFRYRQGAAAVRLYSFALKQKTKTAGRHRYPPPTGFSVAWFAEYLYKRGEHVHLVKSLAEEVVGGNCSLPPTVRGRFISITASTSNATLARALWERYSEGKDAHIVKGDPIMLVPLTRLFIHLIKKHTPTAPETQLADLKPLPKKVVDMKTFLDRVIDEFENQHRPINRAPHYVLTTFVQACFAAGRHRQGFQFMEEMLNGTELPDRYDVNVCLNGVARTDPQSAVRLLDKMVASHRFTPDATTYGTIMSRALDHSDYDLVDKMVAYVKKLEISRLPLKSITGLLRAITTPRPGEGQEDLISRLQDALSLAKIWAGENSTPSPQAGRHLVSRCLHAGEPSLAYQFWSMMVSRSMAWEDRAHRTLRRSIVQGIQSHEQERRITAAEKEAMVSQLKAKHGVWSSI